VLTLRIALRSRSLRIYVFLEPQRLYDRTTCRLPKSKLVSATGMGNEGIDQVQEGMKQSNKARRRVYILNPRECTELCGVKIALPSSDCGARTSSGSSSWNICREPRLGGGDSDVISGELETESGGGKNPWISGLRRFGIGMVGPCSSCGVKVVGELNIRKLGSFCMFVIFSPIGEDGAA